MIEKKIYYGITLILIFSGFSLLAEEKTLDFSKNWHHTRTSALQEMDLERLKARLETSPTIDFPHVDFSTEDYRFHYFMKSISHQSCIDCAVLFTFLYDPAMIIVDGKKIYDHGTENYPDNLQYPNRGPVFIPLKDVSKNSYILLIMIDKSDGITGVIGDTLFGNSSEIFQFILFRDFDQIILWGVYFAIAIIALFLYIIDRDKIN